MKSLSEMTAKEQKDARKLTQEEKVAVDAFIAAARNLPKLICVDIEDFDEPGLIISKRIPSFGFCVQVAKLRKKSLIF